GDDALVFAGKFFANQFFQLVGVEVENFRDQPEDENVFALVFSRSAERFDGETGDRHADVNETFVVEVRLDVVRIVKQHAAFLQKIDVVLITMLIERDEKIGFVAGRKHFARAHADLKDRRSTGNRGWDRHVSHDIVVAASSQAREECAGGLNAVLRISGQTNYGVLNILRTQIGAVRSRTGRGGRSGGRCRTGSRGGRVGWSAARSIRLGDNRG